MAIFNNMCNANSKIFKEKNGEVKSLDCEITFMELKCNYSLQKDGIPIAFHFTLK